MAYFPGVEAFEQLFASGGGNLDTNFPKIQRPAKLFKLKLKFKSKIELNILKANF